MVTMAMVTVTFATHNSSKMSIEAKIAKDSNNPSLNVIQPNVHRRPGRPKARKQSDGEDIFPSAEDRRREQAKARKEALSLHQELTCISGDYITNADSFFTEKTIAPKVQSGESPGILSVGTDCSGMEAPIQALSNLQIQHDHKLSCDNDPLVIKTIPANFEPGNMHQEIQGRDNTMAPYVDLYVAGLPCQPFSNAGKQQGFDDAEGRGTIFFDVVDYIRVQRPNNFILANVKGLVTMGNGKYLKEVMKVWRSIGMAACYIDARA